MPRVKLSDELKSAILDLPIKDKEKLLLRLLPKDKKLVDQLEFKLLEHGATTEDRRSQVLDYITQKRDNMSKYDFHPSHNKSVLREWSGKINEHYNITKDTYGLVELTLTSVKFILEITKLDKTQSGYFYDRAFVEYVISKIHKAFSTAKRVHEDYHLDFSSLIDDIYQIIKDVPSFDYYINEANYDWSEMEEGEVPTMYLA